MSLLGHERHFGDVRHMSVHHLIADMIAHDDPDVMRQSTTVLQVFAIPQGCSIARQPSRLR
jgi:hypothetical protein